ncbi:hypothetical protein [Massilia niastensis]|uniref:hypothetical protein n=1 Tax=Massilia niastensis TaxID=544911 RepID=UPI0003821924|nr:hypothetical protein [Massilia niastensis]
MAHRMDRAPQRYQEIDVKEVFAAVTELLTQAAQERASEVMHKQAQVKARAAEDYRSNAGGWN